jgi:hypothetical protein
MRDFSWWFDKRRGWRRTLVSCEEVNAVTMPLSEKSETFRSLLEE